MHAPVPARLAVATAVVHTLILAAYVLPTDWVADRARYWSQAYARVLFHQDWRLFAPDPPACSCSIEFQADTMEIWKPMEDLHHQFIWRRMAANACRFAEASMQRGDTMISAPIALTLSMENMVKAVPRKGPLHFRTRQSCMDGQIIDIRLRSDR